MANHGRDNPRYTAARDIVLALRAAGHQAFFAGGCVRDLLLEVEPKDFDVATSATPAVVMGYFKKTYSVGAHFGVVLVCSPGNGDSEIATEVATFRHDGAYSDGRRPDAVQFSTDPREDVLRRDFTINGMLLDPVAFEETEDAAAATLDFVGGREDLKAGAVRAIGNPALRFSEDKLRMLRAVRFAARLEFEIEPLTMAAMRAAAPEIGQVSSERIRDELTLMLTEGHARRAFELLDESGLLAQVLPEAVKMHGVEQPPQFHPEGDVWIHTMLLLEKLQQGAPATLAWGALLHDIGKPATFRPPDPTKPGDRIRFDGHVEVGVRIAETILARLRFSNEDTEQIVALVKNHMRFGDVLQMRESTLKRFLRLPRFDEHLALHWMDVTSAHGDLRLYSFAKEKYETAPPGEMRPKLLVTGRELIAAGYKPSPQFKAMLEAAEDAQLEGAVKTTEEGMAMVRAQFGEPPQEGNPRGA
jgi:poly(A) polymerase